MLEKVWLEMEIDLKQINRLRNQEIPWAVLEEKNSDFRLIFILDLMSEVVN